MNTQVWWQALKVIPRVSEEQWREYDLIAKWLIATRSAVFILTFMSAVIGILLTVIYAPVSIDWINAVLVVVGLILAHGTNNLINDWTDYKKGVDDDNYYRSQYGPQTIKHGLLSQKKLFAYISVTGVLALICGILIGFRSEWLMLPYMLAGAFFVLFYTWPLKYFGLGEPAVLLVWGPLMIVGTWVSLVATVPSIEVWLLSFVYGIGPTTVLFGKHIDKAPADLSKKVYTLPVILGERNARWFCLGLWILQPAVLLAAVALGVLSPIYLLILLAVIKVPKYCKVFLKPIPNEAPENYPDNIWPLYFSAHAFGFNKIMSSWLLLSILIDLALSMV